MEDQINMKKSHIKLIIFNLILILFLILNNFILNILNYKNQVLLFVILIISFKILFGFEKDNRRYFKDIIFNILIILLSFFIIFYLLGLVIGYSIYCCNSNERIFEVSNCC